ncbi:MAG: ABC transporter permease [Dehalococcoidia bacterium]|nr:ABC transporter permease [Dehalococcoidia bacterium]
MTAQALSEVATVRRMSRTGSLLRAVRRYPLGAFGLIVLTVLLAVAAAAPLVATHDPLATDRVARLVGPSAQHLMGTDQLGRDVFSRLVYAARPAVIIGFGAMLVGLGLGGAVGLLSGYIGGIFDLLVQRVTDAMMALPNLVVAIAIVAVLGGGQTRVLLAIGLSISPLVTRVVRASTLPVKQNDYVEAAMVLGASHFRLLIRHIVPNIMAPIIVIASVELSTAILAEASLSFLGFGVPAPDPSWGSMLSGDGRRFMQQAPWLVIFPGVAVSLAVLGINLLGDAVRDAFDPRLRGSR